MNNLIGQRIKERRKELKLTQKDIEKITGISNGNLSGIENGYSLPSANAVISLAKILKTSTDWILTGESSISDISSADSSIANPSEEAFLNCFRLLSPNDQEEILSIMNLKISRQKRKKKSSLSAPDQASDIA